MSSPATTSRLTTGLCAALLLIAALASPAVGSRTGERAAEPDRAAAADIRRLSVKSDGSPASALGSGEMSDDGRFAVIASGEDLIVGDEDGDEVDGDGDEENGSYLVDIANDQVTRINRYIPYYSVSGDGSLGAFQSHVEPYTIGVPRPDDLGAGVFVQSMSTRSFTRVADFDYEPGQGGRVEISEDGSTVAFVQYSDYPTDAALYTVSSAGGAPNLVHDYPAGFSRFNFDLSADGNLVTFQSSDESIDPSYNNGVDDIFVKNMTTGSTALVSLDEDRTNRDSFTEHPLITGNGRYVFFQSFANFAGDKPADEDRVYRKDIQTEKVRLVSRDADGDATWSQLQALSSDGKVVAFDSLDKTVTVVRNVSTGAVEPIVKGTTVSEPVLSTDGASILFASTQDGIVPGDSNGTWDVFLKTEQVSCDASGGAARQQDGACPIIVDSTGDGGDSDLKDLACEDEHKKCTLRAAIQEANARTGKDTITFDIGNGGLKTIKPAKNLPPIRDPALLDATTQLGYSDAPLIQLDGASVPKRTRKTPASEGLDIRSDDVTVRGVAVFNFETGVDMGTEDILEASYVGTNADGATGVGNGIGIKVGGQHNTIGGDSPAARNVISGNEEYGIYVFGGSNQIRGNYIGLKPNGDAKLPNGVGIHINQATQNLIGGPGAGARNVISGNKRAGIEIFGLIVDSPSQLTLVQGNYIGTDATGSKPVGNKLGVEITQSSQNIIGGFSGEGQGNVISGNEIGVSISYGPSSSFPAPQSNVISGNLIGTDAAGDAPLPNETGIKISVGSKALIGGTETGTGNVISGNKTGVSTAGDSKKTTIQGNVIGTNASGAPALGNENGIEIHSDHDVVGGAEPGAGNTISGNTGVGMRITGFSAGKKRFEAHTKIKGNLIGIDPAGDPIPNDGGGILVGNVAEVEIGGVEQGAANTISGNGGDGIRLTSFSQPGGKVQLDAERISILGNFIGTDASDSELGNSGDGIAISNSSHNTIGGGTYTTPGCLEGCNVIAFNSGNGISIKGDSRANVLSRNSISDNGGLGIDLGPDGVTANDARDPDKGPELLQNFPVLARDGATVSGTLDGAAATEFSIEIFKVATCDASGNGEGLAWLTTLTASTNGQGQATFSVPVPSLAPTDHLAAIARDQKGNTSEFSLCL